jgi:aromatase
MTTKHVTHGTRVSAPAELAYRLVADVTAWPVCFPPTVHAVRLEGDDRAERIRIWAMANGALRTWVSERRLDADRRTVEFRQAVPAAPVAEMGGIWRIHDDGRVELEHTYAAVDDDPDALALIDRAVDANSGVELAALKQTAESAASTAGLRLDFADEEVIDGPVEEAYEFINACDRWPQRLPHVDRVELTEKEPGLQVMEMDTRSPDGSVHTTVSGRVCVPYERIVYKQTTLPSGMRTHNGAWVFEPLAEGTGVRVTSHHTVVIEPAAIGGLDLTDVRTKIRTALGGNSKATLRAAKAHVEAAERSTA